MREKIVSFLKYLCFICVCASYLPNILFTATYNILSLFLACSIVLCLYLNKNEIGKSSLKFAVAYAIYSSFILSIIYALFQSNNYRILIDLALCASFYALGYSHLYEDEKFSKTAKIIFCIAALYLGLRNVSTIGGFEILDTYEISLKNSSGAILGTSVIIALSLCNGEQAKWFKVTSICIALLLFVCLLTFRNRSTMLALIVCFILFIFSSYRQLKITTFLFYGVVAIATIFIVTSILHINIINFAHDSFFANKDTSDANDLSSGRIDMINKGWSIIQSDYINANLTVKENLDCIDCFPISVYARLGIWGFFIYAPLWLRLAYISIKRIFTEPIEYTYAYFCILALLITSFFESTFPFSPGTAIFASYFFYGLEERRRDEDLKDSEYPDMEFCPETLNECESL